MFKGGGGSRIREMKMMRRRASFNPFAMAQIVQNSKIIAKLYGLYSSKKNNMPKNHQSKK
jgi:hypothetical protein